MIKHNSIATTSIQATTNPSLPLSHPVSAHFLGDSKAVLSGCEASWTLQVQGRHAAPLPHDRVRPRPRAVTGRLGGVLLQVGARPAPGPGSGGGRRGAVTGGCWASGTASPCRWRPTAGGRCACEGTCTRTP